MGWINTIEDVLARTGGIDEEGNATLSVNYKVTFDNRSHGPLDACYAAGVPQRATLFPGSSYLRVKDVSANVIDHFVGGLAYLVTVNYSTDAPEYENPLDEPAKLDWGFADDTRIAEEDKDGNAILNAAGDAFEQPLEVPNSRLILQYSVKEPFYDALTAAEYKDAINDGAWNGFAARTVRCTNISGNGPHYAMVGAHPTQVRVEYWENTYQFEFEPNEWKFDILEQGYRELIAGELVDIFVHDEDGNATEQRASFPYLLTGAGAAQYDDPKVPVYKEVYVFTEKDFSAFNISF